MDAVELQEQQPPEKDGPRRVAFQPDPPKRSSMSEPLLVDAEPEAHRFIQSSRRSKTEMHKVKVERRPMHHKHIFRRPRALQYKTFKEEQEGQEEQEGAAPSNSPSASTSTSRSNSISASRSNSITAARSASVSTLGAKAHEGEERSTHNVAKQRSRLDLFVDLIWVGIIANLSATFGDQSFSDSGIGIGWAYMEFMLLFIVIWRVWDSLRVYTSHFFIDDIMQRNFTLWILVLAVLYGINAPFAYRPHGEHDEFTLVIVIYIVAKFSFLAAHGFQALFIPWLRRQWLFQAAGVVVISAFWTGVIFAPNWTGKIVLIIIANAVEHPITLFMASPTSDRLFVPGRKRYTDVEHHVERYENFFIVILGEGVFRLVNGSPSGMGLNANTGTVLQALLLYYVLHWLYFNGDQCKEYVHALRRTWWKPVVWQLLHVMLYSNILILDASVLFLVQHLEGSPGDSISTRDDAEADAKSFLKTALWAASISLSSAVVCMTGLSLLNRSLDPPGTLVVNSRVLRMAPRAPALLFILLLPLIPGLNGGEWCGAVVVVLFVVFFWEWMAGLEKNWSYFEALEASDN